MKAFTTLDSFFSISLTRFERILLHDHFVRNCLIIAALLRLSWVLLFNTQPVSDFRWYYDRGVEISEGNGYSISGTPTAFWPVGYPGMLGILFKLTGPSLIVPKLLNVLFSTSLLIFVYRLSIMLFRSELSARTSMLLMAFYPNHIAYSSLLATELLFSFLMYSSIILLIAPGHSYRNAVFSGVIGGFASLTKSQFIFVPAIIIVCIAMSRGMKNNWMKFGTNLVLVYLFMIAVILPWSIRNYEVFGAWPIISLNGGVNLLMGNNPHAQGTYIYNEDIKLIMEGADNEYERDNRASAYAIEYIKRNTMSIAKLLPLKVYSMYNSDSDGARWNKSAFPLALRDDKPKFGSRFLLATNVHGRAGWIFLALIGFAELYYAVIIILFITSMIVLRWWRNKTNDGSPWTFGLWIIAYFTFLSMVFIADSRFHFPIMPLVMLYAGTLVAGKEFYLRRNLLDR